MIWYPNLNGPAYDPRPPLPFKRMHDIGACPDRAYGEDCDGIGHWGEDPYAAEIRGDHRMVWLCEGVRAGRADDI